MGGCGLGKGAEFLEWSKDFDLSNEQDEISRLLVISINIRKLHSELVSIIIHTYMYFVCNLAVFYMKRLRYE